MPIPISLEELLATPGFALLLAVLPGFVVSELSQALIIRRRMSGLERVVQALVFTFVSHVVWLGMCAAAWAVSRIFGAGWTPSESTGFIGLGVVAVLLGLAHAWATNSDAVFSRLRRLGFTQRTPRPNEWYEAFVDHQLYVVAHLNDGRRIMGWPRYYSDDGLRGYLFLLNAEWLVDEADAAQRSQGAARTHMLVRVRDIQMVEFVPRSSPSTEVAHEREGVPDAA